MSLTVQRSPFAITATIDRPAVRNAINFDIMAKLEALITEVEKDPELRLFVLTGEGNSFISGGDLREFHQIKDAAGAKTMTRRMMSIIERIENLPCWTLAALNGHTYGGGWELSLAFDYRVASSSVKIGFTQGKFYLPPGWGGITKLTEIVGRTQALYWLASQKVIDAKTAYQAGFIQDIFDEKEYEDNLTGLKKSLTKNDRKFIEYIKRRDLQNSKDEIEPFSIFWKSEQHMQRVEKFLSQKKEK